MIEKYLIKWAPLPVSRAKAWRFRRITLPLATRQFNRVVHAAAEMAEIKKRVAPDTLQHSFATHLVYAQVATNTMQLEAVEDPRPLLYQASARGSPNGHVRG